MALQNAKRPPLDMLDDWYRAIVPSRMLWHKVVLYTWAKDFGDSMFWSYVRFGKLCPLLSGTTGWCLLAGAVLVAA